MANQHEARRNSARRPSHDDVARRAYELFQARGGESGHEVQNWLDAERELTRMFMDKRHDQARSLAAGAQDSAGTA